MGNNWIKGYPVHTVIREAHHSERLRPSRLFPELLVVQTGTHVIFHGGGVQGDGVEHRSLVTNCDVKRCVPTLPLSQNQEAVGGKVPGHLGKDNNSTRVQEVQEKNQTPSNVQKMTSKQRQNYPARTWTLQLHHLPQGAPAPAAGAQGNMAHCTCLLHKTRLVWDNASLRRELEATLDVLGCWGSHRVLKTCQYSPLIFHTNQWEGETGFSPHSALPLLKNLSWVRNKSLCLCPLIR